MCPLLCHQIQGKWEGIAFILLLFCPIYRGLTWHHILFVFYGYAINVICQNTPY